MRNFCWIPFFFSFYFYRLCIKPGIQEQGTECGEGGEWGQCYIPRNVTKLSGECHKRFRGMLPNIPGNIAIRLCIKPGIQERGTECGECYTPGNVLKHSGEYPQTFRGMSQKIPGNVAKYSGESRYKATYKTRNTGTGNGMSPIIPGNVLRHSGECHKTFRGMSPNIPRNIVKHSG